MNQKSSHLSLLTSHLSPLTFLLAVIAGLFYLALAAWGGYVGFPLDDAWIHQTYARNLAVSSQLAFVPGQPSAGSTAPLWSLLLSLGYLLHVPFQLWTYSLGIILLGLIGAQMRYLAQQLWPQQPTLALIIGVCCTLEWHLIWAAVSGMETLLFIWLSVALVSRYLTVSRAPTPSGWLTLGIMGGFLTLTRPEGLGLVALLGLDWGVKQYRSPQSFADNPQRIADSYIMVGLGIALLLIPYMAFHFHLTGKPFPNTLYAKQAEYAVVLSSYPLWWRLFGNLSQPVETVQGVFQVIFIGPQLLLLPGLIWAAWLTVKERRSELVCLWAWWISFLLLYGFRLPVTYQHGRYQMPMIVWVILLGLWGSQRLYTRPHRSTAIKDPHPNPLPEGEGVKTPPSPFGRGDGGEGDFGLIFLKPVRSLKRLYQRVIYPVMVGSWGVLVVAFVGVGALAYQRDVRFIETEMVATARWLVAETPPNTTIAAHDIGAIGYFTQRPLIDLAGLITPEVIPIIRDEPKLLEFIVTQRADYVVIFPSWYPHLSQNTDLHEVYRTKTLWSGDINNDNMSVYQVQFNK